MQINPGAETIEEYTFSHIQWKLRSQNYDTSTVKKAPCGKDTTTRPQNANIRNGRVGTLTIRIDFTARSRGKRKSKMTPHVPAFRHRCMMRKADRSSVGNDQANTAPSRRLRVSETSKAEDDAVQTLPFLEVKKHGSHGNCTLGDESVEAYTVTEYWVKLTPNRR